jgi:hypothetical protein
MKEVDTIHYLLLLLLLLSDSFKAPQLYSRSASVRARPLLAHVQVRLEAYKFR